MVHDRTVRLMLTDKSINPSWLGCRPFDLKRWGLFKKTKKLSTNGILFIKQYPFSHRCWTIVEAGQCCSLSWRAEDVTSLTQAPGWQKVRPPWIATCRTMEVPTSSTEAQVWFSCLEAWLRWDGALGQGVEQEDGRGPGGPMAPCPAWL